MFKTAKTPTIEELLREKRQRWFGHLMREKENDPTRETLMREKARNFKTRKINVKQAEAKALNKIEWRRISSAQLVCNVRFAYLAE